MTDLYAAYLLDSAVHEFGTSLEHELESTDGKSQRDTEMKQQMILNAWLDIPQKYRNPGMVGSGYSDKQDVETEITMKGEPTL